MSKLPKGKKIVTLYMDEKLHFRIEQAANKDNRSVSAFLSLLLNKHFPKPKKRLKLKGK